MPQFGSDEDDATRHHRRADEMGDIARRALVGTNAGGIGAIALLFSRTGNNTITSCEAAGSIFFFSTGIIVTGISIFMQKHKAIKRQEDPTQSDAELGIDRWYHKNWNLDIASGILFIIGGVVGLISLVC